MRSCSSRQAGFTLLELLVAVTVFAIMSVMAHGGLSNVIANSEASRDTVQRLQQVQTAVATISRDLVQIFPRDITDAYGVRQRALVADPASDLEVEFTRSGLRNPAGLARSSLQRVGYLVEDEKLHRVRWQQLDQAQGEEPLQSELIDGVSRLELRFMDDDGKWQEQWPSLGYSGAGSAAPRLRAVEFTLELEDWGEIVRLFEVVL